MKCYLYARWSSLEQTKGSTLKRQIDNCQGYADAQGWTATDTLIDRGRSAYTGDNIRDGQLGRFAQSVLCGGIATPATLVVEELDRLSRQPADVMLSWLSPLVRAGVTIVVTQTGQVIDKRLLDADMGGLLTILIGAFGSHSESRKKAERVASAWSKKRTDAAAGKAVQTHHRHPGWLKAVEGGFEPISDRVEVVKFIFQHRLQGIGKGLTAAMLNERGVKTWRGASAWTATYVARVLRNRAVLGEWQPHVWPREAKERKPVGEPIAGYYPRIIDDATFEAANADRITNQLKAQGRGKNLSNLLGRKARCASCSSQMDARGSARYRTNKDRSKTRHYFLYCQGAKVAKTCDHQRGWTYDRIEQPLLDKLLALAMDDTHFSDESTDVRLHEAAVMAARGEVGSIEVRVARLLDMIEDDDPNAQARYRQRREELVAAKNKLVEAEAGLAEARGAVPPDQHLRRVQEVREMMLSEDEDERFAARRKVKEAISELVDVMTFYPDRNPFDARPAVWVEMIHGVGSLWIYPDSGEARYDPAGTPEGALIYASGEDAGTVKDVLRRMSN